MKFRPAGFDQGPPASEPPPLWRVFDDSFGLERVRAAGAFSSRPSLIERGSPDNDGATRSRVVAPVKLVALSAAPCPQVYVQISGLARYGDDSGRARPS